MTLVWAKPCAGFCTPFACFGLSPGVAFNDGRAGVEEGSLLEIKGNEKPSAPWRGE